jgi:hypothetical protein
MRPYSYESCDIISIRLMPDSCGKRALHTLLRIQDFWLLISICRVTHSGTVERWTGRSGAEKCKILIPCSEIISIHSKGLLTL